MAAKHPPIVEAFVREHAKAKLPFMGAIDTYDSDEHEVDFAWKSAASVLAGEDDWDEERFVALGFLNGDLPMFIDVSKKALPVLVRADDELVRVSASFEAFTKTIAKSKAKRDKEATAAAKAPSKKATGAAAAAVGPKKIYPAPETFSWPSDPVVVAAFGEAIGVHEFLWFDKVKPKENEKLAFDYVRPKVNGVVRSVASRWDARATMKLDRGTGVWLDFARYESWTPVVTPRVKALLESIQPGTLEYLPVRATVGKETADVFIVNVTLVVPCLDVDASDLPLGRELVMKPGAFPQEACFFRAAEYPGAILATHAMVERMRAERLSGLNFKRLPKR